MIRRLRFIVYHDKTECSSRSWSVLVTFHFSLCRFVLTRLWLQYISHSSDWHFLFDRTVVILELRSLFLIKWSLASRDLSTRFESSLKKLVDWVSWHQKVWASNAENLNLWTRIFRNSRFRNFHFQKFSIHKTHQI